MLGCSTVCPNCQHEFTCCRPKPCCDNSMRTRRSLYGLSGGGMVTTLAAPSSPCRSPQISPSAPLAFVLPPSFHAIQTSPYDDPRPDVELQRLADTIQALRLSGWYYEGISYPKIHELLKDTKVGTFLVRDSMDRRFLFSLSVQTERGPTSVRLFYSNGYFRFDAQPHLQPVMPQFSCVVELVQHYVMQNKQRRSDALVWVDPRGKWYSSIVLSEPLRKQDKPYNLKHLARLATNKALHPCTKKKIVELDVPMSLKTFLTDYPYCV